MGLPDDFLRIDTPENVAFDYEVAGIGSRFMAALVDTLVIGVLQAFVYLILFVVAAQLYDSSASSLGGWAIAVLGLLAFFILWGYYVLFEMVWNGQSLGKRWVGLRVIRTDGTPITLTESLIRNLVRLVDFLPLYYGIGVVAMFVSKQARRLGDLAAGTLVVWDRPMVTLESLAGKPIQGAGYVAKLPHIAWPVDRLTNQDVQMAEDFIQRRYRLSRRQAIAQRIAQALLKRLEVSPDQVQGMSSEDIILSILHTYRNS
jgi:uncharacterized RDD family membrane protein YckC